ncbi:P-loop NTPase fold protein [Kutzneria chonburiensis]|uniref:P-loop NTPase fold protein n=1 Tax=Kutzneria chonburiensis TaxID=1483604 RepID=UPI0023628EF3|nr:P-loop NTPase fold protein [Kutzneria chonburiensis]
MPEEESRPTAAELEREFDAAMATDEFVRYREKETEIRVAFLASRPELSDSLYDALLEPAEPFALTMRWDLILDAQIPSLLALGISLPLIVPVPTVLGLLAVGLAGTAALFLGWFSGLPTWSVWTIGLVAIGLTVSMIWLSTTMVRDRRLITQMHRERTRIAEGRYAAQLTHAVREVLRRCVTDAYRSTGVLVFPMTAPTLVELSSGKISPSRTHADVVDFIRNHETSAIGIAGSRGAGKSTLMEAVRNAEDLVTHHVLLTAPVKYDAMDFTRRLFAQAAAEIIAASGHNVEAEHRVRRRRFRTQRGIRNALTVGLFAVLACAVFLWAVDNNSPLAWQWQLTLGLAASVLLILVVMAPVASALLHRTGPTPFALPSSVRLAVDALEDLAWNLEHGQKESGSIKLLTGLLTLGGEDSVTRKRRERSLPELVADFREMLTQFSRDRTDPSKERFVVFIDELEKMAKMEDLTEAVNGIKDLMHIPGVHFVVSVSVDALVQFEQRGMAARDAFDSTFDTVFRMRGLTLTESKDILEEGGELSDGADARMSRVVGRAGQGSAADGPAVCGDPPEGRERGDDYADGGDGGSAGTDRQRAAEGGRGRAVSV